MMAVVDLFDDGGELTAQLLGEPYTENSLMRLAVNRHSPISQPHSKIL
jgi:hypothetical protein